MILNLELDDTERVVERVDAPATWDVVGSQNAMYGWLGNATMADRKAIALATKQVAADGYALRVSFPSVLTFVLGYDFAVGRTKQFRAYVPSDH